MAFQKLPGSRGLIYVPECRGCKKKHPCQDCFACQWCGDDRCNRCLVMPAQKKKAKKKA